MILKRKLQGTTPEKRNLATYLYPDSHIADQFRTIRTNIRFITGESDQKVFLIASPGTGEGKSITIANLAASMAQQKEKILLIDANLRSPVLHTIFNLPNEKGIANMLKQRISLKDAVSHSEIGKLDVLTSGSVTFNPAEILGSESMKDLLAAASKDYDAVLIDAPSVLEYTETRVLAHYCDGVLLLLKRAKTELEKASEAIRVLELAHSQIVGAIINDK
ncbi:polysaccharide biosynthesis tyrosine autokinase [Jeotgalibacillus sp. S-D1]|uniref:CpsD/CapB family tyrosine-protein kinase n=1 Tax=Jeotgalibacillus sp. S-D1 TaxID=2552189 RepID=UPI001059AEC1|nr:CpsD/CapB family tyrosine-protein kinase [Jeotgalibacillus sp. S-D1]TDL31829.1 polysaccharide biosynthesis tyrosine autokinase [Jeotgalibacillus sp. S-D1]